MPGQRDDSAPDGGRIEASDGRLSGATGQTRKDEDVTDRPLPGQGPRLSVVVPTRDRPSMLEGCLRALDAATGPHDEVVVVDSCSTDGATADVARAHGVRVLRAPRPGASLARNLGWRAATGEVVAFVDDDVRVAPGWAEAMAAVFAAHGDADFVTGRLGLRPEDEGKARPVAFFDEAEPFVIDASRVQDLHGANVAVRRSALEAVGGYDEQLGPGARWRAAEDVDLIDRLLQSGRTGRYEPAAAAVHEQWRSRSDLVRLEWRYGIGLGARLARLRRADPERFRAVRRLTWRTSGIEDVGRSLRVGYQFGALFVLVRLGGVAVGQLGAALGGLGPAPAPSPAARERGEGAGSGS